MDDFLQKLKKVVRIVLYGTAINPSDCRKAGPYQLPYNKKKLFDVQGVIKRYLGRVTADFQRRTCFFSVQIQWKNSYQISEMVLCHAVSRIRH